MAIDYEDTTTYTTAAAAVLGIAVIFPVLVIKNTTVTVISHLLQSFNRNDIQSAASNNGVHYTSLTEYTNEDDWTILTLGDASPHDL